MRVLLGMLSCALAACAGAPEVKPLRGPTPGSVLVVPSIQRNSSDNLSAFDLALGAQLTQRGYLTQVGMAAVGKLHRAGWDHKKPRVETIPFGALLAEYGIDAVWTTEVSDWRYEPGDGSPFVFSVRCSLIATRDKRVLWTDSVNGRQNAVNRRARVDPFADRDPFESADPIPWRVENEVIEPREMAELLARRLTERLPGAGG